MKMIIRPYAPKDRDTVIVLWNDCNLVVPWNDPVKDIECKLKVDPDLFLVGELRGIVMASVMGGYDGHRGWINYLSVSPLYQRKGYGRQMMTAVEHRISQKGCPKINLQVRESNAAVIAFYGALGYAEDRVIGMGKRIDRKSG